MLKPIDVCPPAGEGVAHSHMVIPADWRPRPFQQFILKVHSRCDLACAYCYVYQMADQRWRSRPLIMSRATVDWTALRIAEHVHAHGLTAIEVVLHGGEPLLAGPAELAYSVTRIRAEVGREVDVRIAVQTNATQLDSTFLRLFEELAVGVSVSLDGDRESHDRHRRRADGQSSYPAVARALDLLNREPYRPLFRGLLCTIDLRNDPISTYEALLRFGPPAVDFLLPHGNWSDPPPDRVAGSPRTPYADWLIAAFDRWYGAPCQETRVRIFAELITLLFGGSSTVEGVGVSPAAMVVVETDGAIERTDTLASAYPGAAATGLHVARHRFDTALRQPWFIARQLGVSALAAQCRACPVRRVCGGGLYPHRYRADNGFANPSVYCPDLYRLIGHIRGTLAAGVAALRDGVG